MKILPEAPKNESGLTQIIMMGKSIRQIWVKPVVLCILICVLEPIVEMVKVIKRIIIGVLCIASLQTSIPMDVGTKTNEVGMYVTFNVITKFGLVSIVAY